MRLTTRWRFGFFILGIVIILCSVSLLSTKWGAAVAGVTWFVIGGMDYIFREP